MSNPHYSEARDLIEVGIESMELKKLEHAQATLAIAQAEATLALAHEQRTANLIALSEIQGESVNGRATLAQIETRLGLGDTK